MGSTKALPTPSAESLVELGLCVVKPWLTDTDPKNRFWVPRTKEKLKSPPNSRRAFRAGGARGRPGAGCGPCSGHNAPQGHPWSAPLLHEGPVRPPSHRAARTRVIWPAHRATHTTDVNVEPMQSGQAPTLRQGHAAAPGAVNFANGAAGAAAWGRSRRLEGAGSRSPASKGEEDPVKHENRRRSTGRPSKRPN